MSWLIPQPLSAFFSEALHSTNSYTPPSKTVLRRPLEPGLFTGDTVHWNHRRGELDVFPDQTFHSWDALAGSLDRLAELPVEWVFPGHGNWHNVGAALYCRADGRAGSGHAPDRPSRWSARPHTAYDWY